MAVGKKANTKQSNNEKENKKPEYSYGKSSLNFWSDNTMTKISFRKLKFEDGNKEIPELVISIYPLDENRKMIKTEDNKYENGYFNMNFNDLLKFVYGVRRTIYPTKKENFAGAICAHISSESNTGSQLEFTVTDEGFMLSVLYVEEGEVYQTYEHVFSNDQTLKFYNEDGEQDEKIINVDVIGFLLSLESALSSVGGMTSSLIECWKTGSGSGGKFNGGLKTPRKVGGSSLSKRVSDLDDDEEVETEEPDDDEEVEEKPKKKITAKSGSKPSSVKSMKAILDEDDDD